MAIATAPKTRIEANLDRLTAAVEALDGIDGRSIPKAQRQHLWDAQAALVKALDDLQSYMGVTKR